MGVEAGRVMRMVQTGTKQRSRLCRFGRWCRQRSSRPGENVKRATHRGEQPNQRTPQTFECALEAIRVRRMCSTPLRRRIQWLRMWVPMPLARFVLDLEGKRISSACGAVAGVMGTFHAHECTECCTG